MRRRCIPKSVVSTTTCSPEDYLLCLLLALLTVQLRLVNLRVDSQVVSHDAPAVPARAARHRWMAAFRVT